MIDDDDDDGDDDDDDDDEGKDEDEEEDGEVGDDDLAKVVVVRRTATGPRSMTLPVLRLPQRLALPDKTLLLPLRQLGEDQGPLPPWGSLSPVLPGGGIPREGRRRPLLKLI